MHGIEHCRLEAPGDLPLHSPMAVLPTTGSMRRDSPLAAFYLGPIARNGFSLPRNDCRLSATSIPGSKLPACYFASIPSSLPCPFGPSAPLPRSPDCAGGGRFIACGPLHFHDSAQPAAPSVSTPLREFYFPRDQSVQRRLLPASPPDESARFPIAPRRPF